MRAVKRFYPAHRLRKAPLNAIEISQHLADLIGMARGEAFLKRGDLFILCYSTDFIADCFSTFYNE